MKLPPVLLRALLAGSAAAALAGQQVVVERALGAIAEPPEDQDGGPPVELIENTNLDRFLRRARRFLDEQKFDEAIGLLQAVVEGRTLEAAGGAATGAEDPASADADQGAAATAKEAQPTTGPQAEAVQANVRHTVYTEDGRIYRPAARLCQEYMASMPRAGIDSYQLRYEQAAQEELRAALDAGSPEAIEAVVWRYFPTLTAGSGMQSLADLQMQQGRYREAVQTLRDLVDLYPAANRERLGVSALWCRFRIALCLRLAGDVGSALAAARALADEFGDESLRVMGELMPVRELPDSPWFAAAAPRVASGPSPAVAAALLPAPLATPSSLAPLWSFRFAANPYEPSPTRRNNNGFVSIDSGSENVIKVSPPATKYGVGTQLRFLTGADGGQRAVFLENFQLRIADAFTGILLQEGDGESVPPRPQEMRPRPRIPVYDFALQTPVADERRWYAVLGYNRIVQSIDPLRINRIVAYDKASGQRVWSTDDWSEGEDGLVQVTALSAPTVFGEQLLLPVLHKGRYALQALDRSTGQPLWRTPIHSGGSIWFKAPGAQVQVLGSVAYVLTNAGAVAAIDAFAGTLRWIRKYERHDPLRARPKGRRAKRDGAAIFMGSTFQEQDLPGALPSALFLVDGSVVVAPCDSDLLLCLDGASGEVVWMVDGTSRYAPYGSLRHLIGRDAERLYFEASDDLRDHVVSVAAATGIVEWSAEIPRTVDRTSRWPGRGAVVGDWVLLPGDRCVHALPLAGPRAWSRLDLPAFGVGEPPLTGPNNLHVDGAWLAVCYAQGVEVYSSEAALLQLAASAASVREQALFLAQAGRVDEAFAAACAALERTGDPGAATPVLADRERGQLLLAAIDYARESADAMAALDRLSPFVSASEAQLAWRLARMDACRASGDARGLEQEQGALYRYMEGKQ